MMAIFSIAKTIYYCLMIFPCRSHRYNLVPVQYQEYEYGMLLKAGVHMKEVIWLGLMVLIQISCLRPNQSRISMLIQNIRYIWRFIVFLKGLVKFTKIGNFEDLVLF